MAWTPPASFSALEVVTATKLNTHLRDNMKEVWRRVAYVEYVADVVGLSGTHTEAAPLDVVSAGAITYTAEPARVDFYAPQVDNNGQTVILSLWDGATDLGRLHVGAAKTSCSVSRNLTPAAASHTYKVRVWPAGGANVTIVGGAGGVGAYVPGYIAIWQKGGA